MLIIVLAFGYRNFQADAGVHRGLPEQGAGGQVQVHSVPPKRSVELLQSNRTSAQLQCIMCHFVNHQSMSSLRATCVVGYASQNPLACRRVGKQSHCICLHRWSVQRCSWHVEPCSLQRYHLLTSCLAAARCVLFAKQCMLMAASASTFCRTSGALSMTFQPS
jgi:hypothetical protein